MARTPDLLVAAGDVVAYPKIAVNGDAIRAAVAQG